MRAGQDVSWALACGFIADQLKERAPFNCGDTIDFHEAISASSEMNAFVVSHPLFLDAKDVMVDIGVRKVEIVQMVPIFERERLWLRQDGDIQQLLSRVTETELMNPLRESIR